MNDRREIIANLIGDEFAEPRNGQSGKIEYEVADVILALFADESRERDTLRAALLSCARQAEALKRECGIDPESPQAIRNAQYQNISTTAHIALGTIQGPSVAIDAASLPKGCVPLSEYVREIEADPEKKQKLDEARTRLQDAVKGAG